MEKNGPISEKQTRPGVFAGIVEKANLLQFSKIQHMRFRRH